MTILIIFETVEGQTRKISRFVENESRKSGQDVVLVDTANKTTPVSFAGVDKVILAAPVHERRHPKKFETFTCRQERFMHVIDDGSKIIS